MNPPVVYRKDQKTIVDYSLIFPRNLTIYYDLMIEAFEKIEKQINKNITKINRLNKKIFNYVYPNYCIPANRINYYTSRAYFDDEIKVGQLVYVTYFTTLEKLEIIKIDWKFLKHFEEIKTILEKYIFLNNQSGVYVLELQNDKYYIGSSCNIYRRLIQHWSGCGSKWTTLFKPKSLISWIGVQDEDLLHMENTITTEYVKKYSHMNVRGGSFYI